MKTVLVTGLSGMVGSRFKALYDNEYELVNLDLNTGVDITDPITVNRLVGESKAEALIHLAAYTNVSEAHTQNGDTNGACYRVNVTGSENIATACAKYGKYLIHISTDFIFDGTKQEPYLETDTPHPIEWYGETKYLAEQKVQAVLPQHVILRLAYPYSAHPVRPDFVANIKAKMGAGTLPSQFTDHYITPTLVDDGAAVFAYCLRHRPQGIYHMVGSSSHSDFDLAVMVKEAFGLEGEVNPGSLEEYLKLVKRPYQKTMRVSNRKLVTEFGIKMHTFAGGLEIIKKQ